MFTGRLAIYNLTHPRPPLDGKPSCSLEDRISKQTWYDNIIRPQKTAASKPKPRRIAYSRPLQNRKDQYLSSLRMYNKEGSETYK